MPFTPSHAVVALPFLRTPLVPAAIAVGAMAPDLPLFLRGMPLHYGRTHSLEWLPLTILVALGLLLMWRCALRPVVRELSPSLLAERLPSGWDAGAAVSLRETFAITGSPPRVSWRGILLLLTSLAIGIVSHVVWDLFTHEGRWGVQAVPALDELWGPLTGFKWLQHGSSLIGLVVLAVWAILWLRRRRPVAVARLVPDAVRWAWWLSLPVILLAAWGIGLLIYGPLTGQWRVEHLAYRMLPPACAVWGALSVALSIGVQVLRARTRRADGRVSAIRPRRDPNAAAD
ncbi:hypothetical protein BH10ACT5_BH10ACT5_06380 [soil metagenome]|jgi:hypothetical protein|uniref:DUF4184 family protein n=1 Tax=Microbacterium sp. TaxID=51671 RepID=UPI0025D18735|nr:DUF4184 family protein [Microbacterium sp.]